MTSRERVLTAFDHRKPDRVPAWYGSFPEFWAKARTALGLDDEGLRRRFGDDFRRVYARYVGPDLGLSGGATWKSPFGIERTGIGYGQPLSHPLAAVKSVREVEDYPWSPFWHDVIDLMGMEGLYYAMYDLPEVAARVFDKVTDFYAEVSRAIFEAPGSFIDIFFIGNDFGSQTGPLLGVDLFERFAMPSLCRLIDLGHRYGRKVMLHCCGGFRPLIPSVIRAGLDGVHALQPSCEGMEPAGLKRDFGGRLLLNGAIDSHHVLIKGAPESVRTETRRTLDILSAGAGYVAGASYDYILEETPLENVLAMFDTIQECRRN